MKSESVFNLCTLIAERIGITADSPIPEAPTTPPPPPPTPDEPVVPFDEETNNTELISARAATEKQRHPAAQTASPAKPASPKESFSTGQMSLEKIKKNLKRHPEAKSLGKKGSMGNLMADALQERKERDAAAPKGYSGGIIGSIGPYLGPLIAFGFMGLAWAYILYIFLWKGVYE